MGFATSETTGCEIAAGGMGVVYRATQVSVNRPVALKLIRSGELASAAEVQRFRTEAEAAANLDHPNIVAVYGAGEHEGQHYISMKLIEGESLAERVSEFRVPRSELGKAAEKSLVRERQVASSLFRVGQGFFGGEELIEFFTPAFCL